MRSLLALPRTLDLLVRCWSGAEADVRRLVAEKYTAHDEVFINRLFYGELAARLRAANGQQEYSQAVLADLRELTGTGPLAKEARRVTAGIIARASYHEPRIESVTGGDLGLTIVRPSFASSGDGRSLASWLHEQGLLCQAKRQTADGKWGSLTARQKEVLPQHMPYLAILLYRYSDGRRHDLADFTWKPCASMNLTGIERWLRASDLTGIMHSPKVIYKLGNGELGTGDEDIIRDVICVGDTACLKVEITWPEGRPPSPDDPPPIEDKPWHLSRGMWSGGHQQRPQRARQRRMQ